MFEILVVVASKALVYGLLLLVFCWCWYQWKNWDLLQAARKMPCTIKAYPIIGHAYKFLNGWEGVTKTFIDTSKEATSSRLYNVCLWLGPLPMIMIHKSEDVQKILTSSCTAEKADELDYFKWVLGNGLLTAPGHMHKITRRNINPMFHPRNLERFITVFNKNSREMILKLKKYENNATFNVLHPAVTTSLQSICQLVFGTGLVIDTESEDFKSLYIMVVEDAPLIIVKRVCIPWLRIDFIFHCLYKKQIDEIKSFIEKFKDQQLQATKSDNSKKQPVTKEDVNHKYDGFLSLLDVYAELKKNHPQFNDDYLKDECATLFATGTDTVGLTTATCLLALAYHPDIQDLVYEEINSVVGPDDDVTPNHIARMQYLGQVYKETLRWGIIVPYVYRKTSENLILSTCTIAAGNTIFVGLIGPLMDPTIFPDPHKFDPERFSPENVTSRSKEAFIPFSTGTRNCIGKLYAEYLAKTMLVHVLRKYRVSTNMDIYNLRKSYIVTLVNIEGYNIKLHKRN